MGAPVPRLGQRQDCLASKVPDEDNNQKTRNQVTIGTLNDVYSPPCDGASDTLLVFYG